MRWLNNRIKRRNMKKEQSYNEAVAGDEGFIAGDGYPSCEGEPCVNLSDETPAEADTMAGDTTQEGRDYLLDDQEPEKNGGEDDARRLAEEWKDKYVRLQAEFDNYRKRTLREKMDLVQSGGQEVLKAVLPVMDDVQRAVEASMKSDDLDALRKGLRLIAQKFAETLRQKGVVPIESKGREFDADLEEAVARFAAGEEMKGKVVDVIQTGYMLGEKVLRFAKVVVGE